ncbi:hypothetical protein KC332_g12058 [Hortaea werneckii]|nr:hypothetical protein KC358_g12046 [Hortaea werneckii]KAI6813393.1 hypothetical protein KC350_g11588 [Hortaea werneckii]KAI6914905.1 hypothetical protein KC348_g12172 [Hortaea werneckii]KAI6923019.1 hypothetical protein KC341_g15028 [Hortaea werneckii]KAI6962076.1 hypothetical protein KC321_g11963 [Hortaea werneckii]
MLLSAACIDQDSDHQPPPFYPHAIASFEPYLNPQQAVPLCDSASGGLNCPFCTMNLSTMNDDDRHQTRFQYSPPVGPWDHVYPHSHHGTPAQEYSGFNFGNQHMHMEPNGFNGGMQQRPVQPQLHPLVMPQWPSMLNSQAHPGFQPIYPQPVQPIQSMSINQLHTPVSAISARSAPIPRKTLTDSDRKRMCQYAEDHPNAKQTEIGAIFGVERSTVSKVLRQKDKYLIQEDGSKSPVKRAKGRSPDIERALAVWAKNQERKCLPLTDELIRDKARAFSATTTTTKSPDNHHALSPIWLEKFKLKHNLMGARSRKSSLAPEDAESISTCHTPGGASSPSSPRALGPTSPLDLDTSRSQDAFKHESPDNYLDYTTSRGPFHSQSATSLNSAFTDTAPSSFSPGPLSPTSPFFTPDSGTAAAPFTAIPPQTPRRIFPATGSGNSQRPRSQTLPQLDQYMIASVPTETATPKHSSEALDSPMEEGSEATTGIGETFQPYDMPQHHIPAEHKATFAPPEMMGPPPLPTHVLTPGSARDLASPVHGFSLPMATTPEEALRALEIAHSFFQQQPSGFLEYDESLTMGKLMEKLRLQSRSHSISG